MREREGESEREGERVCELCVREKLVLFFMGSRQMDKAVGNRSDWSVTPSQNNFLVILVSVFSNSNSYYFKIAI